MIRIRDAVQDEGPKREQRLEADTQRKDRDLIM